MAEDRKQRRSLMESVKAPLIFSAVLALIAGTVTLISASGGTDNVARVDLALIAFGIVFIISLLVVSMMQLASRENPEHISEGSGVNRNSEELYRRQVAERRAEAARKKAQEARDAEGGDPKYGRAAEHD